MIRPATRPDVAAIADLETSCLGEDAWSEALVTEGVTGELPTISYLVALEGERVVGYAVSSYAGDIAELQRIAVAPSHRRTGLASALLASVVEEAPRRGADRLLLEVREDNGEALAFYASRGFVEVDRRSRYYRDGTTAVVLRLPLIRGCGGSG